MDIQGIDAQAVVLYNTIRPYLNSEGLGLIESAYLNGDESLQASMRACVETFIELVSAGQ